MKIKRQHHLGMFQQSPRDLHSWSSSGPTTWLSSHMAPSVSSGERTEGGRSAGYWGTICGKRVQHCGEDVCTTRSFEQALNSASCWNYSRLNELTKAKQEKKMWTKSGALGLTSVFSSSPCYIKKRVILSHSTVFCWNKTFQCQRLRAFTQTWLISNLWRHI